MTRSAMGDVYRHVGHRQLALLQPPIVMAVLVTAIYVLISVSLPRQLAWIIATSARMTTKRSGRGRDEPRG
jgi:hypothetical protein